jgi:hypothetical protein
MDHDTITEVLNLHEKTKAELEDLVNTSAKKHGPPDESHYDGAKNTLFSWTDDGKGVWILPTTKANFERFEDIAKSRPDLGHDTHSHCEIMRLAGAEFFADWRDSDRARAVKEAAPRAIEEENGAQDHSKTHSRH